MPTQQSAFSIQHSVWAIVPVKSLPESKQRLAHILSAEERAELIHHFLTHTLTVLNQSDVVDRILVISSDARVLATAQTYGAAVLVETAVHGLNPAVTQAVQFAADSGATAVLILPADLPFIEPEDVAIMVTTGSNGPRAILCTDDKGSGTNALLISPPKGFAFHYGENSFQQHLQEAHQRGLHPIIIHAPGLKFDLDTEEDWQKYQLTTNREQFTINY